MVADLSIHHQNIIVAPLCWGLGHASRCIPIIDRLLKQSNTITLATDSEAYDLLAAEYPNLKIYRLPAYDVKYKYDSMLVNMATQSMKVWRAIKSEQKEADRIALACNADIIISDNRLGFRSARTHNIYLTHQVRILASNKIATAVATKMHRHYYSAFDELWVPDYSDHKAIAPMLSGYHSNLPTKYLGPISRLKSGGQITNHKNDLAIILSGPEPQRTTLEKILLEKIIGATEKKIVLVRGTSLSHSMAIPDHIEVHDLLQTDDLAEVINSSAQLVCRAGYSTIMDLITMKKGATLIPTPGQYEQEYLGNELDGKYGFKVIAQSEVNQRLKI